MKLSNILQISVFLFTAGMLLSANYGLGKDAPTTIKEVSPILGMMDPGFDFSEALFWRRNFMHRTSRLFDSNEAFARIFPEIKSTYSKLFVQVLKPFESVDQAITQIAEKCERDYPTKSIRGELERLILKDDSAADKAYMASELAHTQFVTAVFRKAVSLPPLVNPLPPSELKKTPRTRSEIEECVRNTRKLARQGINVPLERFCYDPNEEPDNSNRISAMLQNDILLGHLEIGHEACGTQLRTRIRINRMKEFFRKVHTCKDLKSNESALVERIYLRLNTTWKWTHVDEFTPGLSVAQYLKMCDDPKHSHVDP